MSNDQIRKENAKLMAGISFMMIGFLLFVSNYFFLDNNRILVFVIILIFLLSILFNAVYLAGRLKEKR